jgi:hypothetical protein
MSQSGFTPISLYYSTTAAAAPTSGNLVNGELAINITDGKLYYKDNVGSVQLLASKAGASGTVTSVGQSFTGGLISVAGSPITSSGTLALTVAGTSGGVPYFSSASTWASSAVLTANALMVGGGAGSAPSTITTGTGVVTALGVNTGSAGSVVVNGGALGTPSSGTVTNLTGTASININGTVGATTQNTGYFTTVRLYGSSSGYVGLAPAAAAGSTTYTLPSSDGTNGQSLTTNGSGTLSWASAGSSSPIPSMDVKTSGSGATWTIPAGVTKVRITVVGGGGTTGSGGGGGGGGGTAIKTLTGLTPGNTLTYTVGTAGNTSQVSSGTQTITTISATGGSTNSGAAGGAGGSGSNGDLNITGSGGGGYNSTDGIYGTGGSSYLGGGGLSSAGGGSSGGAYGGGGSGGGGAGASGVVIFEY